MDAGRNRDLDREIRGHLDLEAGEHRDRGLSPDQARYAALRAFGNPALIKEDTRAMWGWMSLERLRQDVRYAARTLRRSPAYTAIAVLSLALGIGANSAIFSLLNAIVLRPLPVAHPEQLVQLVYTIPVSGPDNWNSYFGYPQLDRFRQATTLSGIFGGVGAGRINLAVGGNTGIAVADAFSGDFFSVLGVTPQKGRFFTPAEDRSDAAVAVLSDRYWRSRFNADPEIVGQAVTINDLPFTIIGIAPAGFTGLATGAARDLWFPLHALDRLKPDPNRWQAPFTSWLTIVGRLRAGVPPPHAESELDVLYRRLTTEQLAAVPGRTTDFQQKMERESHLLLHSAASGTASGLRNTYELPLKLLLAVAGIVLAISCANVANLVLARSSSRRREIALRMALGSGRSRVLRQLLTENLMISAAACVCALALAWWGGAALVRMISTGDTPLPLDIQPDWRVFTFTTAISLIGGLLFGLAPAVRATRIDPGPALKEGAHAAARTSGLDRALVTAQVTLSLVLITGAGLFARTLWNLRHVDVGYDRENILLFSTDAKLAGYAKERSLAVYREITGKLSALPGVQSAAASVVRPVDGQYYLVDRIHALDGRALPDSDTIKVAWNAVSPGYFATVGTPVLLGRDFDLHRSAGAPLPVIVNESLARKAFPEANPIGHRLDDAVIIGVVKDSHYNGIQDAPRPVLYRPIFELEGNLNPAMWVGVGGISFELRYRADTGLIREMRSAVASVDRHLPLFRIKTLRAETEDSLLRERLLSLISIFFAALALLLACLGVYGIMAYAVARRTPEIGIRMALGARRGEIAWLVLRGAVGLVAGGIALGVPLSLWASRFTRSLLFGVKPADPMMLAAPAAILLGVAAVAAWLPARRAAKVDPMIALRYE